MRIGTAALATLLLLSGCASSGLPLNYSLDNHAGKGVVFASILYDGWYTANNLYIQRKDGTGEPVVMTFGRTHAQWPFIDSGDYAQFGYGSIGHKGGLEVAELGPGDYLVYGWTIACDGDICGPEVKVHIPFTVKAGEATYLGSYVFNHNTSGFDVKGGGCTLLDQLQRDRTVLAEKFPAMHAATITDAVAGLTTPMDLGLQ